MSTDIFEAFLLVLGGFQSLCTFLGSILKVTFSSYDCQYYKVTGTFLH